MTGTEKIQKAKIKLILNSPFYATLALSVSYAVNDQIETACTDGKSIEYNEKFIESITLEETQGVLAHEVSHIALLHHTRRGGRNIRKWNAACDYATNPILKDAGFYLPSGALLDDQYRGMSAEEIYNKLPDQKEDNDKDADKDPGKSGGVKDAPAKTDQQLKAIEAQTKQLVNQAAMIAKKQGKLPGALSDLIKEQNEPKVNWKEVLNNFLSETARNDYSFCRPSTRYLSLGLYLPILQSIEKGSFALIIDTSASMSIEMLKEISGEMRDVLESLAKSMIVYCVDTKIQSLKEYNEGDDFVLKAKGRGGTDFRPAFKHLQENEVSAAVYFTDGECSSFPDPKEVSIPVFWAVYNNKRFAPPFGEVVHID